MQSEHLRVRHRHLHAQPARAAVARAAVVAVTLLATGCALGTQDQPVPVHESSAAQPEATTSGAGSWTTSKVEVFLVHHDRLIKVSRRVQVRSGGIAAATALITPISDREEQEGLRTALPPEMKTLEVALNGRVATVELPVDFDHLAVSEQILGVAQIVFTLTVNTSARSVQFTQSTQNVAVPNGSGRLVSGPVSRSDYAAVAP